jgi:hypothetical protein
MKTMLDELVELYDFIWETGTELCGKHANDQLIEDFRKGGNLFEEMKAKIVEKYPTIEDVQKAYERSNI